MLKSIKSNIKKVARKFGLEIGRYPAFTIGENAFKDVATISRGLDFPVSIVFDVGANRGNFSEEALNLFPESRVYGFEPHPKTFEILTSRVRTDRFSAHKIALSDRKGAVNFFDYGGLGHTNSLVDNARFAVRFNQSATRIQVDCQTIDDFCSENNIEEITLLKIDTEGNDIRVLKGAKSLLERRKIKMVYFEFNDYFAKEGVEGGSLHEVAEFLAPFGFCFVATYTDYIVTEGKFFVVANCLMLNEPGTH